MGIPTYVSRETVKATLESFDTARNDLSIDDALQSATAAVNGLLRRTFYPIVATREFAWPTRDATASAIWLGENEELISVTSLVSGGVAIPAADFFLEPVNQGPPFNRIELDRGSSSSFSSTSTSQRAITVSGLFGYTDVTAPAGALAEALDATEVGVDVTDSSQLGVGDLVKVDGERMIVIGRSMLTTGQTLQTPMIASNADVAVTVTDGTTYAPGEIVLLDSERMRIDVIAGNTLTVTRAWDGSVLAAHTAPTIYAPRTLVVERGALGTTAATHSSAAAVVKQVFPGLVRQVCLAESIDTLLQGAAGYAREGQSYLALRDSLGSLREQALALHGRLIRHSAV